MLDLARQRLDIHPEITYTLTDYTAAALPPCDAVVSSLSIRYLENERNRRYFSGSLPRLLPAESSSTPIRSPAPRRSWRLFTSSAGWRECAPSARARSRSPTPSIGSWRIGAPHSTHNFSGFDQQAAPRLAALTSCIVCRLQRRPALTSGAVAHRPQSIGATSLERNFGLFIRYPTGIKQATSTTSTCTVST